MTLLSRLGGLVRDVLIGRIFGDTALNSAFTAAFAIPNTFRRLFGEGALSAAFIPAYTRLQRDEPDNADRLASLTIVVLGLVTGALALLVAVGVLLLTLVLPFDADRVLSLRLIAVMIPFMPLICMVAILAGMLQVHGRFAAASSGPLLLNAFIIGVGVFCLLSGQLAGTSVAYALAVATTLSGATQLWWFFRLLRPQVRWTRQWQPALPAARSMLAKFVPVALGLGTLQLNTFLDTLIAMYPIWVGPTILGLAYPLDATSNGVMGAAQRFYQFPLGVFGIAVATAIFPLLSKQAHDPGAFLQTLRRGLRLSLFIGLPASFGLVLVRHDVLAVLYSGGSHAFSPEGVERAAAVLLGFAPGVWAYSLNHMLTRAFYAQGDTSTPMRIAIASVAINIALNFTLMWPLREAGLAWATSISATIQCVVLWTVLHRRVHAPKVASTADATATTDTTDTTDTVNAANPADVRVALPMLRVLVAATIMGVGVWVALLLLPEAHTGTPGAWRLHLLRTGVATLTGAALYLGAARAWRLPELRWAVSRRAGA
jgi:putative peptidoglycan lipid II flippase